MRTKKTAPVRPPLPQKSIDLILKAIAEQDLDTLVVRGGLHPANKGFRAIFTKQTGVVLPKTVSGTHEVVREWARNAKPTPL